jgi:hypothetical protein
MRQQHPILISGELLTRDFQARHIACGGIRRAQIARMDLGYGCPITGRIPGRHGDAPSPAPVAIAERMMPTGHLEITVLSHGGATRDPAAKQSHEPGNSREATMISYAKRLGRISTEI